MTWLQGDAQVDHKGKYYLKQIKFITFVALEESQHKTKKEFISFS